MSYLISDRLRDIKKGIRCEACAAPLPPLLARLSPSCLCEDCQSRPTLFYVAEQVALTIPEFAGMEFAYNGRISTVKEGMARIYLVSMHLDYNYFRTHVRDSHYLYGSYQNERFFSVPYQALLKINPTNANSLHLLNQS